MEQLNNIDENSEGTITTMMDINVQSLYESGLDFCIKAVLFLVMVIIIFLLRLLWNTYVQKTRELEELNRLYLQEFRRPELVVDIGGAGDYAEFGEDHPRID